MEETIEQQIKIFEARCVCTEKYRCNPCRKIGQLKKEQEMCKAFIHKEGE